MSNRQVYPTEYGWVASDDAGWLPGIYATEEEARAAVNQEQRVIRYEIENLEAEQRGRGAMSASRPWTLIITARVNGSESLGEILTDVERRLKSRRDADGADGGAAGGAAD
jgi:hypothetical protein